jgi:hypothetical protein
MSVSRVYAVAMTRRDVQDAIRLLRLLREHLSSAIHSVTINGEMRQMPGQTRKELRELQESVIQDLRDIRTAKRLENDLMIAMHAEVDA